jgi:hypothetical protein
MWMAASGTDARSTQPIPRRGGGGGVRNFWPTPRGTVCSRGLYGGTVGLCCDSGSMMSDYGSAVASIELPVRSAWMLEHNHRLPCRRGACTFQRSWALGRSCWGSTGSIGYDWRRPRTRGMAAVRARVSWASYGGVWSAAVRRQCRSHRRPAPPPAGVHRGPASA